MALQTPVLRKSFPVTDATVGANLVVSMDATNHGNVQLATAGDLNCIGVTVDAKDANGYVTVDLPGCVVQGISDGSGTLAIGDFLTPAGTASGKVKKAATLAFGGSAVVQNLGICLTTVAATDGLLVDFLFLPFWDKP